jgi:hypothetical protein
MSSASVTSELIFTKMGIAECNVKGTVEGIVVARRNKGIAYSTEVDGRCRGRNEMPLTAEFRTKIIRKRQDAIVLTR